MKKFVLYTMSVSASPKTKRALKSIIVWKNKYLIQIKYRLKKTAKNHAIHSGLPLSFYTCRTVFYRINSNPPPLPNCGWSVTVLAYKVKLVNYTFLHLCFCLLTQGQYDLDETTLSFKYNKSKLKTCKLYQIGSFY